MALNAADRLAVRNVILARCTVLVASYAAALLANEQATSAQKAWAAGAILSPDRVANDVSCHVVANGTFIANGSSVSDSDLEWIVQTAINNHFIVSA